MSNRLAVDIGGTFVDAIEFNLDTGALRLEKDFTTPKDASTGVLSSIDLLGSELSNIETFIHGTTLGLNTVIERKGAMTGIITNEGFEDIFEIGRYDRQRDLMYSLSYERQEILVRKRYRRGVPGRLNADGEELVPLDENAVITATRLLEGMGINSIAVCYLHSYQNPIHETRTKEIILEHFPHLSVSLSSDIIREYREYERTSTTVLNAYIQPIFEVYIKSLEESLATGGFDGSFYITRSGGGAQHASGAVAVPVHTLFSGPAGGLIGASHLSEILDRESLITVDMGGTSTDACVIQNGRPNLKYEADLEHISLMIPTFDISTIGAGGGSIARADKGRLLVGPQSAGATPGPVCYDRGGNDPTFTDAALVLNYLDPEQFLGGSVRLEKDAAIEALQHKVATPLNMDLTQAARGIYDVLLAKTVSAIREITVEQGLDPRDFSLLSFGGAGGMFVPLVGREMRCKEIIIPQAPSVFSAWGMLMADIVQEYAQTLVALVSDLGWESLKSSVRNLQNNASADLKNAGYDVSESHVESAVELRYFGQEHSLEIPLKGINSLQTLSARFDEYHKQRYGHVMGDPLQLVHVRVRGIGHNKKPELKKIGKRGTDSPTATTTTEAYCFAAGERKTFNHYDRDTLKAGEIIHGPAIVTEPTTTIVFFSDQKVNVDAYGHLIITSLEAEKNENG